MDSPREAEWRLRADEPRTLWGWILYSQRSKIRLDRRIALAGLPIAATFFGLSPWMGAPIGVLAVLIYLLAIFRPVQPDAVDHASLPTLGEEQASFPVNLRLTQGNRIIGSDIGWITFVDGWLVYEGLRTNFSLNSSFSRLSESRLSTIEISLGDRKIYFSLYGEAIQTRRVDHVGMRKEVVRWQNSPWPSGVSVLPPTVIHPRFQGKLLFELIVAGLVASTVAAVGVAFHQWIVAGLALFLIAALLARTIQGARQLAQDLRQFDALGVSRQELP